MKLRGLYLPSRRVVLLTALVCFVLVTLTHVGWAMKQGLAEHGMGIAISLGVSAGLLLLVAGVIGALHRLQAAGWSFEEPRLGRWLVFYGAWALAGVAIGLGRVIQIQLRSDMPLSLERAAFVVGVCLYATMAMVVVLEQQAFFRRVIADKQDSNRRVVAFLFRSREAFVKARDRQRHEALALLDHQFEPEVEAVRRELARLIAEGLDRSAFEPLARRLDHLRDREVRRLSHLLHPSIIDMGLVPALRALARSCGDTIAFHLELDPPASLALSSDARLQLYRIAEHALECFRGQGVREMRLRLTRAEDATTRLEIAARVDACTWLRESAEWALLEARVGLLGGSCSMEHHTEEGCVLRVVAPPAPGPAAAEVVRA